MSRIGKVPVPVPSGVEITVAQNRVVVKGAKGELSLTIPNDITVEKVDSEVVVKRQKEIKTVKALHGTIRNEIRNMIQGVTEGFSKRLQLVGTGYRVKMEGKNLNLSLGYSHPVIYKAQDGISYQVDGQDKIIVTGVNKRLVGQVAANIRQLRTPEPYKGKGVRYENEVIIKKAGKTSKAE